MSRGTHGTVVLILALLLNATPAAFAQQAVGLINGTATDSTGAAITDAKITLRNTDTGITRHSTTGSDGRYAFASVPIGKYELTFEKAGFGIIKRTGITLESGQVAVLNATFQPAAVAEVVTVTENASVLNTQTSEVGVRFDEVRISELPVAPTRNLWNLAGSAAGVSQLNSGNAGFASGANLAVNGNRVRSNNFMIDGQDTNDPSVSGSQVTINNPDIVREFRLITNQFAAEYGRNAGSVVNIITKGGTNSFHGTATWYHNNNGLNARSNLDKAAGRTEAPFRVENQFAGTLGGPIWRDKTFFFFGVQRWTDRQQGSGFTLIGIPTEAGRSALQSAFGSRPQVQALLTFVPAAQTATGTSITVCTNGGTFSGGACSAGSPVVVPQGSLTNSTGLFLNNWQWNGRMDHNISDKHALSGRYMYSTTTSRSGGQQVTPPGLTSDNVAFTHAVTMSLTSTLTNKLLNEFRVAYNRLETVTSATDPAAETIPSIAITELGMSGINAAANRTAIGLAVNLPQGRRSNTYQILNNTTWTTGPHTIKFGVDFRRHDNGSVFLPQIRGQLTYSTLQRFVDDNANSVAINRPLPGGSPILYTKWYDQFYYIQDTWKVGPTFTLNFGMRYELPGNFMDSVAQLNDQIVQTNGGNPVFVSESRPPRDTNNWQPRFGFNWNPNVSDGNMLHWITGGNRLVFRGGYSRTHDYNFLNTALNVYSSFPFVAAINASNLTNAFTAINSLQPNLSNTASLYLLTRTVNSPNMHSPESHQISTEIQRELGSDVVFRTGYIGTWGVDLYQTLDGNPRTLCNQIPSSVNVNTGAITAVAGCPRVDPTRGVIRLRDNTASSSYHSWQSSLEKRYANGWSGGLHYTWSTFIDTATEIFSPSTSELPTPQNAWDLGSDRARSTYDRPHRLAGNVIYELPWYRTQEGVIGRVIGGWQIGTILTFQSGSPFTVLAGRDNANQTGGIDALVGGFPIRPNQVGAQNLGSMSVQDILAAGGASLFSGLPACVEVPGSRTGAIVNNVQSTLCTVSQRFGDVRRNSLRSDGVNNVDLSISKKVRIAEAHQLQLRLDMFNMTNTRDFGVPAATIINVAGFLNEKATSAGNRRMFVTLRYSF